MVVVFILGIGLNFCVFFEVVCYFDFFVRVIVVGVDCEVEGFVYVEEFGIFSFIVLWYEYESCEVWGEELGC